jgi:N-ethylmaleimide reductase
MSKDLFSPYRLGQLELPNRMVMAPMTRLRAYADGLPSPLMKVYYAQRASAGLIITECTKVSEQGHGLVCSPGMSTAAQAAGWSVVTRAVHEAGGRIYLQLWHCGRISHSSVRGGELPVAPSAVAVNGQYRSPAGSLDFETPRALETAEIPRIVDDFRKAASYALQAGFDGVELHGAYGYLVDEFLQDGSNRRGDRYGGTPQNRCRFAVEVMEALADVWGAERIGMRISPSTRVNDMLDSNPLATFGHLVRELNRMRVGYLHVMEPDERDLATGLVEIRETTRTFRAMFDQTVITNVGYSFESGNAVLTSGVADLVAYGKLFLANPDLPQRFRINAPSNPMDFATFYGSGASSDKGYTDYPALLAAAGARAN